MARVKPGESVFELARPHAKRRRPPRPWGFILTSVLLVGLLGAAGAARLTFKLVSPHTTFAPLGTLSREKRAQMESELELERPFDREQAIDFALDYTAETLSLAPLGRDPSFDFNVGKRKAGSAEYAAFFVTVFEAASKRAGSTARAFRVRSQLRIFNRVLPLRGFGEHDWVMVYDPADDARIYLDPILADAYLGWSLARNVKGGEAIPVPPLTEKGPPQGALPDQGATPGAASAPGPGVAPEPSSRPAATDAGKSRDAAIK